MCIFKRKKKNNDELDEYAKEKLRYQNSDDYEYDFYKEQENAPCFVTTCEIFKITNYTVIMGVALKEIKVGDTLVIGNMEVEVLKIIKFREDPIKLNPGDNGALYFRYSKELKNYVKKLAKEASEFNRPINLSGIPTKVYTYFYNK